MVDCPNKEEVGAAEAGVAKREDEGAEAGVLRNEKPAPEEGFGVVCGVAELVINPATWLEVCVLVAAGRCRVGWTLLAAASCFAVSLRSASRNGSLYSPLRLWSARYAVLIDSMCW